MVCRNFAARAIILSFGALSAVAAEKAPAVDESKLPPAANTKIDFERDIKPIFEGVCFRCHGTERPKSHFSLTTRESALKGGDDGIDIIPGQSAKSPLIHYVARLVPDMEMPPEGKGQPLTAGRIGRLRAWIDQGASWGAGAGVGQTNVTYSVAPTLRWVGVSGNAAQFRELYWQREGWSGGLEHFQLKQQTGLDQSIVLEGRLIPDQGDYKLNLDLEKKELGFARFGFEQFRKYFNDSGGYYPSFNPAAYSLDRDLHLNVGKAWAEFGLTQPRWPKVVLGYEYQYRSGAESTLNWGPVTDPATNTKSIYPSAQQIDEKAHLVKLDISHTLAGIDVEDNLRGEFYHLSTDRPSTGVFAPASNTPVPLVRDAEGYNHWQVANALHAERQVTDWFYASVGYLYSKLDGDASFNLSTLTPSAAIPPYTAYVRNDLLAATSQQIVLNQQTHMIDANAMLGPWKGLWLSTGLQNEWMYQHGLGNVTVTEEFDPTNPTTFLHSDYYTLSSEENVTLRYTSIPYTVVYAEARFKQEKVGDYEEENNRAGDLSGLHNFAERTDITRNWKDYRTGFNLSPWQRVSLNAYYKRSDRQNDYNALFKNFPNAGNEGYPAFIRSRDTITDEFQSKLALNWTTWLKTAFTYQIIATDYHTTTDPALAGTVPGGPVFAGKDRAHVYSASATVVPWRRLYLSTTVSYRDSLTKTAQNEIDTVVPYQGNTVSLMTSATFALTPKTDLQANYVFSRADYGQNNFSGLPLGIVYDWHGMQVAVTRKLSKNVSARLQYGYYQYDEPSSGTFNDFTAHAVMGTLRMAIP